MFKPQFKQEFALRSPAKVILYGGAKGGGKSFALRLAPLYNIHLPDYRAVIFRRTLSQCKRPGGLWDKSYDLYPLLSAIPKVSELKWIFPSGATIQFSHLIQDNSYRDWFGSEVAFFGFDQLEEFTKEHFLNILGCMRTTADCCTQIFATINPDSSSWVRHLVDPWIDHDGYVNLSKDTKIFYFNVVSGEFKYGDRQEDSISCQYISADVYDNKILLESDPNYLKNLKNQSYYDRERFLGVKGRGGNWNVKIEAGKIFKMTWFKFYDVLPRQISRAVRFWDFAMSIKQSSQDDYTVGCLVLKEEFDGVVNYYVEDIIRVRMTPVEIDKLVYTTTVKDDNLYSNYSVRWYQDPGSAGVKESVYLRNNLRMFDSNFYHDNRSKINKALSVSRLVETGCVRFNQRLKMYLAELEGFPDLKHDDVVDAFSGAIATMEKNTAFKVGNYKV